jgi:hypothetical protein
VSYSEEHYQTQRRWAEDALFTLREALPLMSPVSQYQGWSQEERRTLGHLLSATARTSESALLLCAFAQIWDAEVLTRSVLEGSLKFSYLLQSHATFAGRHREYASDLFNIALLKDHRKAAVLLEHSQDLSSETQRPIRDVLLSDEELEELSNRYPPRVRRRLEGTWGFTGLIGELSTSGDPYFSVLPALAHKYSMASHIQHVDTIGASIPLERDKRSSERRETAHLAHAGRVISDLLEFFFLRMAVGYRFVDADRAILLEVLERINKARAPFKGAYNEWIDVEYTD